MTTSCERCGTPRQDAATPCARCALDQALRAATPTPEERDPAASSRPRQARPPAPTPDELCAHFPGLELEVLLGEGGMGCVYRARQKKLGRTVALKLLHADLSADPAFVARFLREASALARLAHPGIVAVHEYGEQDGRCWLVMEYVDGTNLRALLREKRLEPRQALDIVTQLCDALQFAHDEGVVHRDIKPENVLVDRRGRVKLADFGLAKLVGAPEAHLTQVDQVMGTPHYMAPEQVERPRDVDHRADLYSLGVVFYEMLTGELPLGRFAPPSQRVEVDVRLDEIVLRSLEHERERRYQHAVQVKTDVRRVEDSPTPPVAASEPARNPGVFTWGLEGSEDGLRVLPGKHSPTTTVWACISMAAWLVCLRSFNLGAFGLVAISLPMLGALFSLLARQRPGTQEPRDARELGRRRWKAGTSFVLGMLALFGALTSSWERFSWNYLAPAASPSAGIDALRGRELEALLTLEPALDLAGLQPELQIERASIVDTPDALLRQPWILAAVALACLAAAAWHQARPRRAQAPALLASALLLFLGPLLGVLLLSPAVQGFRMKLTAVQSGPTIVAEELAPLAGRLYTAILHEDWRVSAEHDARIVDRLTGTALAEVRTFVAAPSSPFARWRIAWRGPVRVEPQVIFTLLSRPDTRGAPHTYVFASGGLAETESATEWSRKLQRMLQGP